MKNLEMPMTKLEPGVMPLQMLGAGDLILEIAHRRRSVAHPLFVVSFALFCLTLLALAYLPESVGYKVFGAINVAYILAITQFGVTFLIAAIYAYWAKSQIDPLTAQARLRLASQVRERVS